MSMYALTLQPAGMITHAIVGNFSAARPKEQQVVLAQGERLSLITIDKDTDNVRTLLSTDAFGILRNLSSSRVPGTPRGMLCIDCFRPVPGASPALSLPSHLARQSCM